ncbi:hypothetical protein VIGAN_02250600, partial [Vigna angularis var. angularis]
MTTATRQRAMRELIFSVKSSTCKGKFRERKSQLEHNRYRKSTILHQSSSSPTIAKLLFKPASRKKPEKPNRRQATMSQIHITTVLHFETHSIFLRGGVGIRKSFPLHSETLIFWVGEGTATCQS